MGASTTPTANPPTCAHHATPPASAETQNPAEKDGITPDPQSAKRAALKQNEKEFRAGVDRLYQLASELKQEVDKTVTTEVFSVRMYKRTEEIEKVAKLLKGWERRITRTLRVGDGQRERRGSRQSTPCPKPWRGTSRRR